MADVEEPQFNALAERIAALKKQHSFQNDRICRSRRWFEAPDASSAATETRHRKSLGTSAVASSQHELDKSQ
ncbi:hypothetical protein ESCO_003128 [Escovopsis weberi]|uniref:Uncharacterized protein n=1 Tax=Escovopsis weberi TaxID=150374 RepID=A0A0M9VS99_ESCWE|nr:hypothetical protein ESCO_003128 [Escovopsis weberi]